ncbi:hypothetical protein NHX12_032913 [Muraenolepis orangiensis]|uniref:Ig-like domain-containing protein n=1 Tax=Muraenolepis orangiensis TaxID=630683 RepID=A0A9Q0E1P2_9TELE|nr:hypothetical protein NHX12_032913 [Muraenolepis orangiensis]
MACRLLGLTTFVFHASASKVASGAVIWVWPPGTDIYPGESVVLQCGVPPAHPGPQQDGWSYAWFRHGLRRAPPALHPPRHLAYRDTYAITGAAAEDAGGYRCRAEGPGSEVNGSGVTLFSEEVRLTVSDDTVILKGPYLVSEGDRVILHCQFRKGGGRRTATFFKDGVELATRSSGLAMENVSKAQEGFYKCTSPDRTLESPESWLSVQWTWIISSVAGGLLLFSIGLIIWLIHHRWGKQRSALDRRWPSSKADVASADVPETKQDVTEVQWDLSWMEMSGLLDKP